MKHLFAGKTVTYTVCRLRGYLHGDASLVFRPEDLVIGVQNIHNHLRNFRLDEKPYNNPRWEVA